MGRVDGLSPVVPNTLLLWQVMAALKAGARSDGDVTLVLERQKL